MRDKDNSLTSLRILVRDWMRETDLEQKISRAKALLELAYPGAVVDIFLSKLDSQVRSEIKGFVESVEHCAFIGASLTQAKSMEASLEILASQAGFPSNQQSFLSTIVAKELGSYVGKEEIATIIFKAQGKNAQGESISIEVFLPETEQSIVNDWIARGIGTHIALRVKTLEGILAIYGLLSAQGISMPAFMHNTPMENAQEGSTTMYFDILKNDQNMRLEFYYKTP